jgi:hypothetical protein
MALFFHDKQAGPLLANFAIDTFAKNLNLQARKFTMDNYFIGYFTIDDNVKESNGEDIRSRFQRGINMMRLFMENKENILSEPQPCDSLPSNLLDLDLLALKIFSN